MKKLVYIIVFLVAPQLYAQKIFNFGAHAGLNVSHLSTSLPDYTGEAYLGFRGGVFGRINIKRFHIQPEVNFSMVGGQGTFSDNPNRSYSSKVNTLEIPLLLGFKVLDFKLINIRLQAGGYWAWNITNTIHVHDVAFPQNDTTITSNNGSDFNGGIIVGAGVDIWRFTLDLRYQWGLANLYGSNNIFQDPRAGFKHGTFAISLGFKIL